MAASGSIRTNVTSDGYIYLQLSWSEASQSIEGNYTNINWNLRLISTGHGANIVSSAAKSCTIKFNGTTVFNGTVNIGLSAGQTKTLRSGSNFRINHNSDGKKTFSYSFSQQINITYSGAYIGTKSASGSGTLDTIPRASSISSISGNTIGSSVTVNIDRKASSFTHRVYYSFGNTKNYLLESGVGTSLTFTPAMSDCASVPNAASGTATIRVDTYSGSTKIGTASKNFTLNVPASVKPTIGSFTAERIDGTVPSDWGIYVKGKSKAKLTISGAAAGGYGATLKSYSITGGGYTGSTAEYTTGFLNTAGTITFTGKVTDSRGRTASKTVSVTVEDYAPPVIQSASAARCDASGSLQDDGAYVLVTHSLKYSSLGGKNSLSRSYRFRRVGETSWQNVQYTETEAGDIVGAGNISPDYSYEIELKAKDDLENVSRFLPVSTAKVIMDWKEGGAGMAIGKVSEKDGLEVAWPAYFHRSLQVNPEANGGYGISVFRANDDGEKYKVDFAVGKSGNTMSGYMGLFSPDGETLNSLQVAEDGLKVSGPAYLKKVTFPFGSQGILYGTKEDGTEISVLEPSISGNFSVYGRGNLNGAGGGAGSGGTTYVMGHNIGFRISDMASGVQSWNPYYNRGQSFTIGIDTTGFIFSNPKYLYFVIPLYKPVVGGPTITAATGDGMIVRCNGKFAYGSSDSNKIRPASYVVSQTTTCIRIRAEFGNTTNATANTAIGVYWHGTITFS